MPSFSRPSVSDDNPYSEALFRTLKYHPSFPSTDKFKSLIDVRAWSERFVGWYNKEHLHSALKFVTPEQRHTGIDKEILIKRHNVYQMAKKQYPERWPGNTRNWTLPEAVMLNPNKKNKDKVEVASADELEKSNEVNSELFLQERQDGAGNDSRQAANAVRQHG